ncbi:MAG: SAM-dependent methyltransferase, partial [Paludibacteraceae bacterium]|nr:SAM-dependent methyltransferase [Paludibacteraceae bacterium]
MLNEATWNFVRQHLDDDVRRLALQVRPEQGVDLKQALQQIEGRQLTRQKLPTISRQADWLFPPRLNIEQCSSETTAAYKASLLQGQTLVDLTGGFGIDCYVVSRRFRHTDYVEQNPALTELVRHNFSCRPDITLHQADSTDFLSRLTHADCIMIDPARRDDRGRKVAALSDCTPDVCALMPQLLQKADRILLKLSPMLDIQQ